MNGYKTSQLLIQVVRLSRQNSSFSFGTRHIDAKLYLHIYMVHSQLLMLHIIIPMHGFIFDLVVETTELFHRYEALDMIMCQRLKVKKSR